MPDSKLYDIFNTAIKDTTKYLEEVNIDKDNLEKITTIITYMEKIKIVIKTLDNDKTI